MHSSPVLCAPLHSSPRLGRDVQPEQGQARDAVALREATRAVHAGASCCEARGNISRSSFSRTSRAVPYKHNSSTVILMFTQVVMCRCVHVSLRHRVGRIPRTGRNVSSMSAVRPSRSLLRLLPNMSLALRFPRACTIKISMRPPHPITDSTHPQNYASPWPSDHRPPQPPSAPPRARTP